MRFFRVLLLLLVPGCALMDDYGYDEQEYYLPAETSCGNVAPAAPPAMTPVYSPAPPVQPAGYQTREPPAM